MGLASAMGEGEPEGIGDGLCSIGCDGEGRGVGVGVGVKVAEGDGVGDAVVEGVGRGVAGRGIGAAVGVKVAEGDGVSVVALEGVPLDVAGWRRQSNSSKTTAIAALSLQKSRKDRSEKRLIGGEAEYLQAPRNPQPKGGLAAQRNCSVVRTKTQTRTGDLMTRLTVAAAGNHGVLPAVVPTSVRGCCLCLRISV